MRIVADHDTCEGLGMCEAMAPDFFEVGDDDLVKVLNAEPDESDRADVEAATLACPVLALKLEG